MVPFPRIRVPLALGALPADSRTLVLVNNAGVRWLLLLGLVACERADERAIGWEPIKPGEKLHALARGGAKLVSETSWDYEVTADVLATDGDRISKLRLDVVHFAKTREGTPELAISGKFEASAPVPGQAVEIAKVGGTLTDHEREFLKTWLGPLTSTMADQRPFFEHRFHVGERYQMPDRVRTSVGFDKLRDVTLVVTSISAREIDFDLAATFSDAPSRTTGKIEIALDRARRFHLHLEIAVLKDGKQVGTVTSDTTSWRER